MIANGMPNNSWQSAYTFHSIQHSATSMTQELSQASFARELPPSPLLRDQSSQSLMSPQSVTRDSQPGAPLLNPSASGNVQDVFRLVLDDHRFPTLLLASTVLRVTNGRPNQRPCHPLSRKHGCEPKSSSAFPSTPCLHCHVALREYPHKYFT